MAEEMSAAAQSTPEVTATEGATASPAPEVTTTQEAAAPAASAAPEAAPAAEADWRGSFPSEWSEALKGAKSADEAKQAFERGMGYHPATRPEDIELKLPESFKGGIDEGVQRNFKEFCVAKGITPSQAQDLLDWQLGANKEIYDRIVEDGTKELQNEWGSRFAENREGALKAFVALDKRMGGKLATSMTGRNMANDPVFVRAFYEISRLASEDTLAGGGASASPDGRETAEETYRNFFKE